MKEPTPFKVSILLNRYAERRNYIELIGRFVAHHDIIFSSAALHWIDSTILPNLMRRVEAGGAAVQIPNAS
jgi:trans-aconitate methyltransferase